MGLVLGGGGIQGAVWLEGALAAMAAETGWNPADAEVIVGTSAGSWLATLLAAGVPPWLLAAQSSGERMDGLIPGARPPSPPRVRWTLRERWEAVRVPGSPPLFLRAALPPWELSPVHVFAGWFPRGYRDSRVEELVRLVVPRGWPAHPKLWCVACDYRTGERVVLGPSTTGPDVATAVAASCAVPGYYRPTRIGGREYVDGGVHSVSNLDLVAGLGLDLVICLNPTSSLDAVNARTPAELAWSYVRQASGRRLGHEAKRVRRGGTEVLLIQPTSRDLAVLGSNWLRASRHAEIIAQARETVTQQLRQTPLAATLDALPRSPEHLVRRPAGARSGWPALVAPPAWSA